MPRLRRGRERPEPMGWGPRGWGRQQGAKGTDAPEHLPQAQHWAGRCSLSCELTAALGEGARILGPVIPMRERGLRVAQREVVGKLWVTRDLTSRTPHSSGSQRQTWTLRWRHTRGPHPTQAGPLHAVCPWLGWACASAMCAWGVSIFYWPQVRQWQDTHLSFHTCVYTHSCALVRARVSLCTPVCVQVYTQVCTHVLVLMHAWVDRHVQ